MRRWIIESTIYLVLGFGLIAMLWLQGEAASEPSHLLLAAAFVVGAAILIPSRVQIARIRRERKIEARDRIDTFR